MSGGYSETPLVQKLGFKPEMVIKLVNPPANYQQLIKVDLNLTNAKLSLDAIHFFVKTITDLHYQLPAFKDQIKKTGVIWVSWPKKISGVETDLDENIIRDFALDLGLVDVKVCAIDEVWSGLKLVFRLKDR